MRVRNKLNGQFYKVSPKGNLDSESLEILICDLKRVAIETQCLEKVFRDLNKINIVPVLSGNCLKEDSSTLTKMLRYCRNNNVSMFDVQNLLLERYSFYNLL